MFGFITQFFRGQTLYLRKHRVNAKTKAFVWSPDKDDALRMNTGAGVELMKIMRGFCSPAMIDRRGCVITTGGKPKTKEQLNAELRWLREARSRARHYGRSLYLYEKWQKKQAAVQAREAFTLRDRKPPIRVEVKPQMRMDYKTLTQKLDARFERLILRKRPR